jgi:DNA-binding transcriptional LysR family regulator
MEEKGPGIEELQGALASAAAPRLSVRHLEIFWAVMRSGNQHEAARQLGLSQPAVSKLLRYTEHQIGFPLFDRIKGRLHATPEAHVFFHAVDGIFGRLEAAERLARDLRRRLTGRISITTSSAFNPVLLPAALAAFRQAHALVRIGIKVLTPAEALERVANGEADLGLAYGPVETSLVDTHVLRPVSMICGLPTGHNLARLASVSPRDLGGEALITATERPLWGKLLEEVFTAAEIPLDIAVECTQSDIGFALAEAKVGIAIMPSIPLQSGLPRHEVNQRLTYRPFRPSIEVLLLAVTGRDRPISHAVAILIEQLRQTALSLEWAGMCTA